MEHENSCILIGWYGGDEAIACSGWSSTYRELTPEKKARMGKFIWDLWHADPVPHGTPFEKASVHFLANTDIATHIQLLKHRIGVSINGESARYKELKEDKFYIPEDWKDIKISDESSGIIEDYLGRDSGKDWAEMLETFNEIANKLYHASLDELTPLLGRKRAKESARFFKPYSMQYLVDIQFNMRSFQNFLIQRNDKHAQKEIREIAQKMLDLVQNIEGNPFKHTLEAITSNENKN